MQNLTATIPHQLGRAEAKRRIQEHIGVVRRQHAGMISDLRETWKGDTLDFAVSALGQSVTGKLTVEEQVIHLSVALPWIFQMLGGTVQKAIEQEGRYLLSKPASRQ